ncbi:hypothetical protein FNF29_00327 [Cafeteria roenbergensis]|uniref:Uncharacterized protein n=1 Tax=Cafeteria roenbergensis TaxID=33653 RepID=A0A5A8CX41_CAFRO|nr:hypothetical protein FNF29_00327 [Cafeteria roenbergensis]|eukprot:KAA0157753.1 hypothetical protein FNF29_00327 [Cafeteria roenbergensis]
MAAAGDASPRRQPSSLAFLPGSTRLAAATEAEEHISKIAALLKEAQSASPPHLGKARAACSRLVDALKLCFLGGTPMATWREMVTGLLALAFHVATPPSAQSKFLNSAAALLTNAHGKEQGMFVSGWSPTAGGVDASEDGPVAEYHAAAPGGLLVRWRPLLAAVTAASLGPIAQRAAGEDTTTDALRSLVQFVQAARPYFVPGAAEAIAAAFDADLGAWDERADEALVLMAVFMPRQPLPPAVLEGWAVRWSSEQVSGAANCAWATLIHDALKAERLAALLAVKQADHRGDTAAAETAAAACAELQASRASLASRLLPLALSRFQASLRLRVAGSTEQAGGPSAATLRIAAGTPIASSSSPAALAGLLIELLPAAAADSRLHTALGDSWSDADDALPEPDAAADADVDPGAADESELDRIAGAASSGATLRGLARILRASLRFAHPSNAGSWSSPLAQAVESLAKLLCEDCTATATVVPKRALSWSSDRLCVSRAQVDAVTDLLLPVCKRLLFNRSPGVVSLAMSAVDNLATVRPRRAARFVGAIALDALAGGSSVSKSKPIVAQNLIQRCAESLAWPRPHLPSVVLPVIHCLPSLMRTAEPVWCMSAAMLAVTLSSVLRFGPQSGDEAKEWPDAEWVSAGAEGPSSSPSLMEAWDLDRSPSADVAAPLRRVGLSTHPLFGEAEDAAELSAMLGLGDVATSSSSSSSTSSSSASAPAAAAAASLAMADAREAEEAAQASLLVWASETLAAARKVVENAEASNSKTGALGPVSWVLDSLEQINGTPGVVASAGVAGLSLADSAGCTATALFAALPDDCAAAEAEAMVAWALSSAPLENSNAAARLLGCAVHRAPALLDRVVRQLLPGLLHGLGCDEAVANDSSGWAATALADSPLARLAHADSEAATISHRTGELLTWRGTLLCGAVTRMGDALLPYMGGITAAGARMANSDGGGDSVRELGRALVASVLKATSSTYVLPVQEGSRNRMVRASGDAQAVEFHTPSDAEVAAVCAVSRFLAGPAMLGALAAPASAAQLQTAENACKLVSAMLRAAAPLLADSEAAPIQTTAKSLDATTFFGEEAVGALLERCAACGVAPVAKGEPSARHLFVSAVAALLATLGQATHTNLPSSAATDAIATGTQPHLSASFVAAALALASDALYARGRRSYTADLLGRFVAGACERHSQTADAMIHAVAGWPVAEGGAFPAELAVSMHPASAEFTAELFLAERDSFLVRRWTRAMRDPARAALDCNGSADLSPEPSVGVSGGAPSPAGERSWPVPLGHESGGISPASWVATGRGPGDGVGELERPGRVILGAALALAASPVRIIAGTAAQYVELMLRCQPWQRLPLARQALGFLRSSPWLSVDPKAATDEERRRALGGLRCATVLLGGASGNRVARVPDIRFGASKWLADGGSRSAIELAPAGHTAEATAMVVPVLKAVLAGKEPIAARSAFRADAALSARADAVSSLAAVAAGSAATWADRVFAVGLLCAALPIDLQHSFPESGPGDAGLVARVRGKRAGVEPAVGAPLPSRRLRQASSELSAGEVAEAVAAFAAAALDSDAALPVRSAALAALASYFFAASGQAARLSSPAAAAPAWGAPLRQAAAALLTGADHSAAASSPSAPSSVQAASILAVLAGDGKDGLSPLQRLAAALREDHDEATTGADGRPKAGGSGRGTAAEVWSAGVGQSVGAARLVRAQTGLGTGAPGAHATLVESLIECAAAAVTRGEVAWAPAGPDAAAATDSASLAADVAATAASAFLEQSAALAAAAKATGGAGQAGVEERRSSGRASTEIWAGAARTLLRRVDSVPATEGPLADSVAGVLADLAIDVESRPGRALCDALSALLSAMAWWPMEWVGLDWGLAFHYAVDSLPPAQGLAPLFCVAAALAAEGAEASRRAESVTSEAANSDGITSLARAQRLAALAPAWQDFLGRTCSHGCSLAESAAAETSSVPGMAPAPGGEPACAEQQLLAARAGHRVAVTSLLPAAAALSAHPSEPVRTFAGQLLAMVAGLAAVPGPEEASPAAAPLASSPAAGEDGERVGAAVPAVVRAVRGLLPSSQAAADAAAALSLADPRTTLHNGRIETVASAVLRCSTLNRDVAGVRAVLLLFPALLSLGRLAAGDDAAQAKVMQVMASVQAMRFTIAVARDAAAVVEAADSAVVAAGGDSWAAVRATAESGAVLQSFPYTMPAFLPRLAVALAEMAAFPPPVRDSAREALAEFRRTHGDTWETDRLRFTRDQLDAVGSLGSTSAMYA